MRLSASAPLSHALSSAAFTINIAESNFRHTQPLLAFFGLAPLLFIIAHVYTLVHLVMLAAKVGRFDQEICRQFTALLHHITIDLLKRSYLSLERDSAPGIDGVTWQTYGENLEEKLARPIRESAVFWSD